MWVRSIRAKGIAAHRWTPVVLRIAWVTSNQTGCVEVAVIASIVVMAPRPSIVLSVGRQMAEVSAAYVVV